MLLPCRSGIPQPSFSPKIFLLALFALLPIPLWCLAGYGGHDFYFHPASWLELHRTFAAHEWELGWAAGAQYGYGDPRFGFYPPFSLLLGALLSFVIPLRWLPGFMGWLILFCAGLSMWSCWGRLFGERHRLPGSVLYMWNWYLISCIVIRYSVAEAWTLVFLPVIFLTFYCVAAEKNIAAAPPLAFFLALSWLSNIPGAITFFYGFGVAALVLTIQKRSFRPVCHYALAEAAAICMAGFRIFPTMFEKSHVHSELLLLVYNPWNTMLFHHIPPPHMIIYFFGGGALLLAIPGLMATYQLRHGKYPLSLSPYVVFLIAPVFLVLPLSLPFWKLIPELVYVQFPFRFLGLFSLSLVFLVLSPGISRRVRGVMASLLLCATLYPFFFFFHNLFSIQRFPHFLATVQEWQTGYEGVREYVTQSAPLYMTQRDLQIARHPQPVFEPNVCQAVLLKRLPNELTVQKRADVPCSLTLNVFDYPFWHVFLGNATQLSLRSNREGLITVELPPGPQTLDFRFIVQSTLRTATDWISSFFFLLIAALWIVARKHHEVFTRSPDVSAAAL